MKIVWYPLIFENRPVIIMSSSAKSVTGRHGEVRQASISIDSGSLRSVILTRRMKKNIYKG